MTKPILSVRNICKSFNKKEILSNLSFDVQKGEIKVLIGPSGGGKSSLLQCLNFLIFADSGEISFKGNSINPKKPTELRKYRQQVGMIFQDFNLFEHLTALENVTIALRKVRKFTKKEATERALKELTLVGLQDKTDHYPAQLSGGQKQRVSIARALAMDPTILLLDEPTSALDPELVNEVLQVIKKLADNGMTMIMATHQMDFAQNIAHEILFIENGTIIEQGSPKELLCESQKLSRTYSFCSALGIHTGEK